MQLGPDLPDTCTMHCDARSDHALSERRHRTAFERMALPGVLMSADSRLLAVNDAFADLVGLPSAQLLGRELGQLCRNEALQVATSQCRSLLARGGTAVWEQRIRRGNNAPESPVLVHATFLEDSEGGPGAISAVVQDLSHVSEVERALTATRRLFDVLATGATDWAGIVGADCKIRYMSGPLTSLGYSAGDVTGMIGFELVHPDDIEFVRNEFAQLLSNGGTTGSLTFRVRAQDDEWRWIEQNFTNLLDDPGVSGIVVNGKDVTQRMKAQQALEASEARFRAIVETVQDSFWVVDATGHTVYANDQLARLLDVPLESIYASPVAAFLNTADASGVADKLCNQQRVGLERYDVEYDAGGSGRRVLHFVASPIILDDGNAGSVATITDVTADRLQTAALVDRALHDDVTGLANRAVLIDRLRQALARSARSPSPTAVAAIALDIDRFSLVNDSFGYELGDQVLATVGHRLVAESAGHASVARTAGDQFVVIVEDADESAAIGIAERLLGAVALPLDVAGERLYLTASAGVAVGNTGLPETLLRRADAAMHQVQEANRGHVGLFDEGLAANAAYRLGLVSDLRQALSADQLQLHYQPIIDLADGKITGVEALLRWTHPARGVVSPAVFVPVAEEAGLAAELDEWVLWRAGRDYQAVAAALGPEATVSVNISASNLPTSTIEEMIGSALRGTGMPAGHLILEVTEGAVMHDPERARQVLLRLREEGMTVALDDFGTGYSSLGYLARLPVQRLKLDRLFVSNITADADALALASSIVAMGQALRMTVVAEGVESVEQMELLQQLGCDSGQGFLWSAAVPLGELARLVQSLPASRFAVTAPQREAARLATGDRWGRYGSLREVAVEHGLHLLVRLARRGASAATIAAALNAEGFRSPRGTRWHHVTVTDVLRTLRGPEQLASYPPLAEGPPGRVPS